ncbi:MAG: succinate dehydrogenase, hydrophobic membrane anchor protein [Lautropia sp.]
MSNKRVVTGAHYGLRDWIGQRVTAVILALYTLLLLFMVATSPTLDYGTWAGLFVSPFMKIATLLAAFALMYHAWIGTRDIYMDYIQNAGLRLGLQVVTIVLLVGYALWTVIILWRV